MSLIDTHTLVTIGIFSLVFFDIHKMPFMYLEDLTKGVKKNDLQTLHTNFKLDHKEKAHIICLRGDKAPTEPLIYN
jgi:hypothetical protein